MYIIHRLHEVFNASAFQIKATRIKAMAIISLIPMTAASLLCALYNVYMYFSVDYHIYVSVSFFADALRIQHSSRRILYCTIEILKTYRGSLPLKDVVYFMMTSSATTKC